jgi:hypothetical protein
MDRDSGLRVLTRASGYQRDMESAMGFEVLRRGVVSGVWPERKDLMADRRMELRNIAMQTFVDSNSSILQFA